MDKTMDIDQGQADINNMWWATAVVIALFALYICSGSWKAGVILLITAGLVSPYGFSRALAYLKSGDPLHARVLIVLFALAGSTYVFIDHTSEMRAQRAEEAKLQAINEDRIAQANREAQALALVNEAKANFAAHRADVLAEFSAIVESNDFAKAEAYHQRYMAIEQDPDFAAIVTRYQVLKYRAALAAKEQEKNDRIAALLESVKTIGATDYGQAIAIYRELWNLDPSNKSYKQSLDRFTKIDDARQAKEEKDRLNAERKAQRQKDISAQFSGWDGSHHTFERLIKAAMNDPDSYKHVDTTYDDKGSYIRVYCKFRGKNGFGGTVVNTKVADFTLSGDFIKEVK